MQLGFVSAILPDLALRQVLEVGNEYGYDCVELMCWPRGKAERRYAGVTHVEVANFTAGDAAGVNELAAEHSIKISGLGYYPNPLCPVIEEADRYVEHIRQVIVAAELLNVRQMNTFVGRDWTRSVDENWPRFLETWKPLIQFAENHGVKIGIENCPMLFGRDEWPGGKNLATTPSIWQRMFNDISSDNFGLNYDPSHMVWQHMDYLAPLRDFGEKLFHVHAKDVRVDKHRLDQVGIMAHPLEYHSPKLPGMGDVDWGQFFSVLNDEEYRGPVCVEVEDRAYEDSLAARKASLTQSATYLRQFVARHD